MELPDFSLSGADNVFDGHDDIWQEEEEHNANQLNTSSSSSEMVPDDAPLYQNKEEDPEIATMMFLAKFDMI